MNSKVGIAGAIVNLCGVIGFAISMVFANQIASYFTSILIAFGFVIMICSFCTFGKENTKSAGYTAIAFATMYATVILIVYFTQMTTVRLDSLNSQAQRILNYQSMGLFFNFDLLGYCFMAIATFFGGLTIKPETKTDKWLKALLLIHGMFAICCFIMPVLGVFSSGSGSGETAWIGTVILEIWCIYFTPVGILSLMYFKRKKSAE